MERKKQIFISLWIMYLGTGTGCGRISNPPGEPAPQQPDETVRFIPVEGNVRFGSQCQYGPIPTPQPKELSLHECPMPLGKIDLVKPPETVFIQVDCEKKLLDIRSLVPGGNASVWEIMPDGSFTIRDLDGGQARLRTDGADHQNCNVALVTDIWGKVDCKNRYEATISLQANWWLNKSENATSRLQSPCTIPKVPEGCYFYSSADINQCS